MVTTLGPALFLRQASLTVGTTDVTGLDFSFHVKKNLKGEPNTASIKVVNLSPATRKTIEATNTPTATGGSTGGAATVVPCVLVAGYQNATSTLFSGELRAAQTVQDGARLVTELSTGDGDQAISQTRLTVALGQGSTAAQGLRSILSAMGVGQGNLSSALTVISQNPALANMFALGRVFKGSASEIMTQFCRASGLEWSIQNGQIQFLPLGQPLAGQAILIDSSHGMEGSPTVDTKGILSVTTRLIPGIAPGVKLAVTGKYMTGSQGYRVTSVEYIGDTRGSDWSCKIEADVY